MTDPKPQKTVMVRVQAEDFDLSVVHRLLREQTRSVGAIASFVGIVRDINDAKSIASLELEHYPGMTERSIREIVDMAAVRWELLGATVIHRVGLLLPTDQIVLVAVSSMHRGDAFSACEFIMDFLKTRAPFWKKEVTPDGERWVDARVSDQKSAQRWEQ